MLLLKASSRFFGLVLLPNTINLVMENRKESVHGGIRHFFLKCLAQFRLEINRKGVGRSYFEKDLFFDNMGGWGFFSMANKTEVEFLDAMNI